MGERALYYFRVVADGDDWLCKRGSRVFARCETVMEAVDLAAAEAALHAPSQVFFHDTDGHVTVIAEYATPDIQLQQ